MIEAWIDGGYQKINQLYWRRLHSAVQHSTLFSLYSGVVLQLVKQVAHNVNNLFCRGIQYLRLRRYARLNPVSARLLIIS